MARNIELLNRVADHVEAHPENFDMGTYFSHCGTTACIAGWAWWLETGLSGDAQGDAHVVYGELVHIVGDRPYFEALSESIGELVGVTGFDFGRISLGLDYVDAENLFYAKLDHTQAAAVLRMLAEDTELSVKEALGRVACFERI